MDTSPDSLELILPPDAAGKRLDVALAEALPERSRSFLARLLKDGAILVNGREAKPRFKVQGGERIELEFPEAEAIEARPEPIPLAVLFEDADVIVVDKPAGMVTHPSKGHATGTLVNALLAHCADLSGINGALRPGIVHRLDRETSGVIVAAKNDRAHRNLQEQFMARTVRKTYLALAHGQPAKDRFACEGRIGRHPSRRMEMTVLRGPDEGRAAHTDFEVLARLPLPGGERGGGGACLLQASPRTGRTHQIRVHLAKAGHPVFADGLYGREGELPELGLRRHALHAWKLAFAHPRTQESLNFTARLAEDMDEALRRMGGTAPVA
ncbi:MAG: RluA family pseudouridine synthase [Planctomycetota bacterium]|nr:RluA family pseudouridine synthase [Planctomycetota bacterium]